MRQLFSVATLCSTALLVFAAAAEDWPQWRGTNRDDVSQEKGLMQEWPEGGPERL